MAMMIWSGVCMKFIWLSNVCDMLRVPVPCPSLEFWVLNWDTRWRTPILWCFGRHSLEISPMVHKLFLISSSVAGRRSGCARQVSYVSCHMGTMDRDPSIPALVWSDFFRSVIYSLKSHWICLWFFWQNLRSHKYAQRKTHVWWKYSHLGLSVGMVYFMCQFLGQHYSFEGFGVGTRLLGVMWVVHLHRSTPVLTRKGVTL